MSSLKTDTGSLRTRTSLRHRKSVRSVKDSVVDKYGEDVASFRYKDLKCPKEDFRIEDEVLGRGRYGVVFAASYKNRSTSDNCKTLKLAAKVVDSEQMCKKYIDRELQALQALPTHRALIKFERLVVVNQWFYFIMERVMGENLLQTMVGRTSKASPDQGPKPFNDIELMFVVEQLVSVAAALRKVKIAHRDIKPENIMVTRTKSTRNGQLYSIKLIDFGTALVLDDVLYYRKGSLRPTKSRVGTEPYQAPEVYMGNYHTHRADIWSIGATAFVLNQHRFLHNGFGFIASQEELNAEIDSMSVRPCVKALIRKMVSVDERKRSRAEQLCSCAEEIMDDFRAKHTHHETNARINLVKAASCRRNNNKFLGCGV